MYAHDDGVEEYIPDILEEIRKSLQQMGEDNAAGRDGVSTEMPRAADVVNTCVQSSTKEKVYTERLNFSIGEEI